MVWATHRLQVSQFINKYKIRCQKKTKFEKRQTHKELSSPKIYLKDAYMTPLHGKVHILIPWIV